MTDVRERLAEVLAFPTSFDAATFDAWRYGMADAILSDSELVDALVRSRLEQVGWHREGTFVRCRPGDRQGTYTEPVYRIKGETTSAPDLEGAQE